MICRGLNHHSSDISNDNIVSYIKLNNTIFESCKTRPFRWIYVKFFNSFSFLTEVIKILQKMQTFRQFKDHNSEREHEN